MSESTTLDGPVTTTTPYARPRWRCDHQRFRSHVHVMRHAETEGGPITSYSAGLTITCAECGTPFVITGFPLEEGELEARFRIEAKG